MTVTIINAPKALELIDRAVAERSSDYKYPGLGRTEVGSRPTCHYVWDTDDVEAGLTTEDKVGQPACIVGQAFDYAGVLSHLVTEYVESTEEGRWWARNDIGIDELFEDQYDVVLTPLAKAVLIAAQTEQDSGSMWGTAKRVAHRLAEENPQDLPDTFDL